MSFYSPQKPWNTFELMLLARTRVFVRSGVPGEYWVVSANLKTITLLTFCVGSPEPTAIRTIWATAQELHLFDGHGWDLLELVKWLDSISPDNGDGD